MTPEAQQIAIAEACGYADLMWTDSIIEPGKVNLVATVTPTSDQFAVYCVPDYLNDLNAMHEAEKVLTPQQWPGYIKAIERNVTASEFLKQLNVCYVIDVTLAHAAAAQRAAAFLRTLGL